MIVRPRTLAAAACICAAAFLASVSSASRAFATDYVFAWANPTPQGNALWGAAFEDASAGYAVGERGVILRTTDGGATWSDRTRWADFPTDLYDAAVLGAGDVLAVGDAPGIYRSTDAGDSFTPVTNPSTSRLHNIHRLDAATLTVVGDAGAVIRSTDNGATWSALPAPGAFALRDQYWSSAADGYVCGDARARRTTNAGATWTTLPGVTENGIQVFTDVRFLDPMNGWLFEHFDTFRTTDGGASWFKKNAPFPRPIYQHEALFIDATTRYVITLLEGADIWRTTDDGLSWTLLYERNATVGYADIDRLPDGALAVVSGDGDLLRSSDAGATWENFTANPGDDERRDVDRIEFLPGGRAFAGGSGFLWLASEDAGETWAFATPPPQLGSTYEIEFFDDALGFAGGAMQPSSPARICRTTDGGASWTSHTLSTQFGWVHGIAIVDASTQFAVTYGGDGNNKAYRTTDGGSTWEPRGPGLGLERAECVQFLDASTGFVGGGAPPFNARVLKTTDGGATWALLGSTGLVGGSIRDMHWFSAAVGLACGDGGAFRTTNGGANWTRTLVVSTNEMDFRDAQSGYVAGFSDDMIWETADGGTTWSPIELPWTRYTAAVVARPDGFFVCGDQNSILRARDASATGVTPPGDVEHPGSESPLRDALPIAIAPNPSAGMVSLRFENTIAGRCVVNVFEPGGRRVAAFDRFAPLGAATIDWDPREIPAPASSGHYFVAVRDAAGRDHAGRFLFLRR
jgi:photosystem II stability/assembly factor-like uncharacterized protein